jgi:hypothetical protein
MNPGGPSLIAELQGISPLLFMELTDGLEVAGDKLDVATIDARGRAQAARELSAAQQPTGCEECDRPTPPFHGHVSPGQAVGPTRRTLVDHCPASIW